MTDVDLEERLRRALAARAAGVTAQQLRPIVAERRGTRLRWWLPLSAGLAAAAVVTFIFVVFHRTSSPDHPIAPAASVPATAPSTPGAASEVPSSPGPAGSRPAGPVPRVPRSAAPGPSSSSSGGPEPASSAFPGSEASPPVPTPGLSSAGPFASARTPTARLSG